MFDPAGLSDRESQIIEAVAQMFRILLTSMAKGPGEYGALSQEQKDAFVETSVAFMAHHFPDLNFQAVERL